MRAMIQAGRLWAVLLVMPGESYKGSWPRLEPLSPFPCFSHLPLASPGMFSRRWQRATAAKPNPTSPFQVCMLVLTSMPQKQVTRLSTK